MQNFCLPQKARWGKLFKYNFHPILRNSTQNLAEGHA